MSTGVNYISLGVSLGMLFSVAIGSGSGNLAMGISVGIMLGTAFGIGIKKKIGKREK